MEYRNLFLECGYSQIDIKNRVESTFQEIFYGENAFFHKTADHQMGYMEDTGNHDARTEGMSYGMMMCVQMNRKEEFDCLWRWARQYMYMDSGENKGYFAWSVSTDGKKNAYGPAPDGEEFFAMALFFASHRWGDGEGIWNYSHEACELLHTCIHKGENGMGRAMWDPQNYLIRFITECDFTDPSYHLPHFYTLFAKYAYEEDRLFWEKAAQASRKYLQKAFHKQTGLNPEYSDFDGKPHMEHQDIFGRHDWFYSDAYRTIANIALDYVWFEKETNYGDWIRETVMQYHQFFRENAMDGIYLVDGTRQEGKALHPIAIIATTAQASLAADTQLAKEYVKLFWETPLRTGKRRYYDNCLYMFAMLALSGNYRMW